MAWSLLFAVFRDRSGLLTRIPYFRPFNVMKVSRRVNIAPKFPPTVLTFFHFRPPKRVRVKLHIRCSDNIYAPGVGNEIFRTASRGPRPGNIIGLSPWETKTLYESARTIGRDSGHSRIYLNKRLFADWWRLHRRPSLILAPAPPVMLESSENTRLAHYQTQLLRFRSKIGSKKKLRETVFVC